MDNISFTGFLALVDNNERKCTLNTNNIVGVYQDKDSEEIKISLNNNTSAKLAGYSYAQVQKALIEADTKGFFELKKEEIKPKAAIKQNSDILDAPKEGCLGNDIFDYITDDIKGSTGGRFCPNSLEYINFCLRNNDNSVYDNEDCAKKIKACDAAFEKLPPLDRDEIFYRGVYGTNLKDEILNAKEGEIIIPDNGYAQVGFNIYVAEKYLPSKNFNPVLFVMECPKGSKVSKTKHSLTGTGSINEGLMPRAQKFEIQSKKFEKVPHLTSEGESEREVLVFRLKYIE